jgi:hypothetical protein
MGQYEELRRTLLSLPYRFLCIRPYGHNSLLLGPINRTLEGWISLPLLLLSFAFSSLDRVDEELYF